MFLLIFFYPRYVLQLGFQLSYLAVFGIVFITPLFPLSSLPKLVRKGTEVLVVTFAAQVGVALLSSYTSINSRDCFYWATWYFCRLWGLFCTWPWEQ